MYARPMRLTIFYTLALLAAITVGIVSPLLVEAL